MVMAGSLGRFDSGDGAKGFEGEVIGLRGLYQLQHPSIYVPGQTTDIRQGTNKFTEIVLFLEGKEFHLQTITHFGDGGTTGEVEDGLGKEGKGLG